MLKAVVGSHQQVGIRPRTPEVKSVLCLCWGARIPCKLLRARNKLRGVVTGPGYGESVPPCARLSEAGPWVSFPRSPLTGPSKAGTGISQYKIMNDSIYLGLWQVRALKQSFMATSPS